MIRFVNVLRFNRAAAIALADVAGLTSCQREQITSYQIPKEEYSIKAPSSAQPQVRWTAPEGWTERPGQGGRIGFRINGADEKYADVRIIPLRASEETEKQSVNIWRDELGLAELP